MAAADCFDLMIDGPDIHCPKCNTPLLAWNWGGQILYTCKECNALGFNIERAGIEIDAFDVEEVLKDHECGGCSRSVEKRKAPNVELYTCSECNVALFANVKEIKGLEPNSHHNGSCANHREMRALVGKAYEKLVRNLR